MVIEAHKRMLGSIIVTGSSWKVVPPWMFLDSLLAPLVTKKTLQNTLLSVQLEFLCEHRTSSPFCGSNRATCPQLFCYNECKSHKERVKECTPPSTGLDYQATNDSPQTTASRQHRNTPHSASGSCNTLLQQQVQAGRHQYLKTIPLLQVHLRKTKKALKAPGMDKN